MINRSQEKKNCEDETASPSGEKKNRKDERENASPSRVRVKVEMLRMRELNDDESASPEPKRNSENENKRTVLPREGQDRVTVFGQTDSVDAEKANKIAAEKRCEQKVV